MLHSKKPTPEGSEFAIIKGSEEFIVNNKPSLIVEFHLKLLSRENLKYFLDIFDNYSEKMLISRYDIDAESLENLVGLPIL